MGKIDWEAALDLEQAVANLKVEMVGDWHQDPWGWPELGFFLKKAPGFIYSHCGQSGSLPQALVDVPKENWGTRPAVVLDVTDRLTYQALVDRLSVDLIGDLSPNVFGWRLPPITPEAGRYSHNNMQWERYRGHLSFLAAWHNVALRTDIVAFFASIPVNAMQEAVQDRCSNSAVRRRLCNILEGFDKEPERSGLPQRSTASSVLANLFLSPLDDVLSHYSTPLPRLFTSKVSYRSFARWMDDIWLFGEDPAIARRAQTDLQDQARSLGLQVNNAKTDVLEGDDVAREALQIEHSAVDEAIAEGADFEPLEELVDCILGRPERTNRTSIKFATLRMREHGQTYRAQDLVFAANRMPHAADALARLFKELFTQGSLQDWFLEYATSDWATHQWAVAHFGRMFPSSKKPRKALRTFFADAVRDANSSLPLLAVSAQRLAAWDPGEARTALRDAWRRTTHPQARRVLALTALGAGETRTKVRSWLEADRENAPTGAMLEEYGFAPPRVQADFAK